MGFITYVKHFLSLKDDEYKYKELATALEDYNMLKIRVEDLIEIVHKIFEDHPMLLSKFQKFLPQEATTSIVYCTNRNNYSGYESKNQACKEYIEKVKTRCENGPDVYYSFLTILDDYGKEEWRLSLVGKVYGDKVVNFNGLKMLCKLLEIILSVIRSLKLLKHLL
ncbi:hypothetical protein ACH5RR_040664 [Cinchona calisaya]|uniref:Uncharacterized protein n=1 Tax=Cinchona calisaya TaxID=153742 RepID=A0ABD2XUG5_9GENT